MDIEPSELYTWRTFASCAGLDWPMFFPNRGESTREAKAVCQNCPVKDECLDDAVTRKEPAGVRGGMATRERRKIIQARKRDTI